MAFLNKVFSKKEEATASYVIEEAAIFTQQDAQNAFYSYLFPKKTEKPLSIPQKLVIDVVKNSIQDRNARKKSVPRLPSVIPRLLRSLKDPDSSVKDYVEIVNKDPVMSASVLKLANSVYFNPIGARINEIERAVVKLGIDGLRSVLSAAVMQPIIQKESAYFTQAGQKIWQHSLNCAVACELIAHHRGSEKFKVYILGLMHDVGKITIFSELCKQFKINNEEIEPGYNAFAPLMIPLAPAVSYWVAKDWELPQDVCKALAEQVNIQAGNKVSPFAKILYDANIACEAYATIRNKEEKKALALLKEMNLPTNLYDQLDQLTRDV